MITNFAFTRHADPHRSNDWVPGYKAQCSWVENGEQFSAEWDRHELEELLAHFDVTGVSYSFELIDHWTGERITQGVAVPNDLTYVGPHDPVWLLDHPSLDIVGLFFDYSSVWEAWSQEIRDCCDAGVDPRVIEQFRLTQTTCDALEVPTLVRLLGRQSILDYYNDF